ncbi:MAG: DUF5330 domain-containing protein [Ancalomicrobiaceae bacterium]|nr:DUF5330 domain-containing protein [Ancalomicrobiaceae bacterium]
MGFLFKVAFWLSLVILLIPADESETRKLADGRSVGIFETFGLAQSAYEDAKGFCGRNPDACATGEVAASTFGAKARTGARWVYSWFDPSAKQAAALPQSGPLPASQPAMQPMPPAIASQAPAASPATTGTINERRALAKAAIAAQITQEQHQEQQDTRDPRLSTARMVPDAPMPRPAKRSQS